MRKARLRFPPPNAMHPPTTLDVHFETIGGRSLEPSDFQIKVKRNAHFHSDLHIRTEGEAHFHVILAPKSALVLKGSREQQTETGHFLFENHEKGRRGVGLFKWL